MMMEITVHVVAVDSEDTDIALGPAISKEELIDTANRGWPSLFADED